MLGLEQLHDHEAHWSWAHTLVEPVHTDLPAHDVPHIDWGHLETWQQVGTILGSVAIIVAAVGGLIVAILKWRQCRKAKV